jgi:4,5-DOPA dioxygenase extradiol
VLLKAFPAADVPVIQLSLDRDQSAAGHLKIGAALAPLRKEGILLAGSGNIVHNLQVMEWSDTAAPYDWATSFNEVIKEAIVKRDWEKICNPMSEGVSAAKSLPTSEHYLPLLYACGAAGESDTVRFDPDFIQYKSLSMTSVTWTAGGDAVAA